MTSVLFASLLLSACDKGASSAGARPGTYGIGHTPSAEEIAAIDIDVNPSGAGLPAGQGTAAEGATIFGQKCAACHGPHGEGIDKNPRLIGKEPPPGFTFANDAKAPKTIGNYWPYATTLYDYMHRAMPLTAPGSLTPHELYALSAYLLSENGIVAANVTLDARSLSAVQMPARNNFVKDDRMGGSTFR